MIIKEIKPNGFCGGVKRSLQIINEALSNPKNPKPFYMLGYLVHNKKIVSSYQNIYGVNLITSNYEHFLDTIDSGTIIFTAHGISPKIYQKASNKRLNIIDTTCNNVKNIQQLIASKVSNNNDVLVIGNENHPEVLGYLGISPKVKLYKKGSLISNNSFIINQTTLIYNDVLKIYEDIKKINPSVAISEEVCAATRTRQSALIEHLNDFDMFIIIGDKLSNNCQSMYDLLVNNHKHVYKVEDVLELNQISFENVNSIGITAGASTPPCLIKEIIEELENYYSGKIFTSKLHDKDYLKY